MERIQAATTNEISVPRTLANTVGSVKKVGALIFVSAAMDMAARTVPKVMEIFIPLDICEEKISGKHLVPNYTAIEAGFREGKVFCVFRGLENY